MSTRPNSRSTVANTRSIWSVSVTSPAIGSALRPSWRMVCAVASMPGCIAVKQHEVGAGLGQRDRHGAAHALGASGNDGGPAGQIKQVRHGIPRARSG